MGTQDIFLLGNKKVSLSGNTPLRGYRKIIVSTMPHLIFKGYSTEHQQGHLNGQSLNSNVPHRSRISENNFYFIQVT